MFFDKSFTTVAGLKQAILFSAELLSRQTSFEVTPLPDDDYEFCVYASATSVPTFAQFKRTAATFTAPAAKQCAQNMLVESAYFEALLTADLHYQLSVKVDRQDLLMPPTLVAA